MNEFADGNGGMHPGSCPNRAESSALSDKSKSLVLVNYFESLPIKAMACIQNSQPLLDMLHTCYGAAGNRWANFVAVDFYKVTASKGYLVYGSHFRAVIVKIIDNKFK